MEELARVISEISKAIGCKRSTLLDSSGKNTRPCEMLCFIIKERFPHLIKDLATMLALDVYDVCLFAKRLNEFTKRDQFMMERMNRIMSKLDAQVSRETKSTQPHKKVHYIKPSLGFVFTEEEEARMREMCLISSLYMEKLCNSTPSAGSCKKVDKKKKPCWYQE